MTETKKLSPKELEQAILSNPLGEITDDQLSALFGDEPSPPNPSQVTPTPAGVIPAQAPTTVTPAADPNSQGQPNELPIEGIPEKFQGADLESTIQKVVKSYADLEDSARRDREELAQLRNVVSEISKRPVETQTIPTTKLAEEDPTADIDDTALIEKPRANIDRLIAHQMKKAIGEAIVEYDTILTQRSFMNQFRNEHKDFDELKPTMRQIVQENPTVNSNPYKLPEIYEEAKRRKATALEGMKKEVGVDRDKLKEELRAEVTAEVTRSLVEGLKKRKTLGGLGAGSTTTTPVTRSTTKPNEVPTTPEDQIFNDMMNSGPDSSRFLKNE